jgi:DNA-binding GntR family transcriptional regulator
MSAHPDPTSELTEHQLVLAERLALYFGRFSRDTTRLPDTADLAHRFHASHEDVRAALGELRRRHLVRIGRHGWHYRAGLIRGHLPWPMIDPPRTLFDTRGWDVSVSVQSVQERVPAAEVARVLDLAPGGMALRVCRVAATNGDPAGRSHTWLHPVHGASLAAGLVSDGAPPLIDLPDAEATGYHLTQLRIDIRPATPQVARYLQLSEQLAVPRIVLVYRTEAGDPLAHAVAWLHPQYFHLSVSSGPA